MAYKTRAQLLRALERKSNHVEYLEAKLRTLHDAALHMHEEWKLWLDDEETFPSLDFIESWSGVWEAAGIETETNESST